MRLLTIIVLTLWVSISAGAASAHEFIVVPEVWHEYQEGQEVPVSVFSTHVFVRSEELEDDGYTELRYQGAKLPLAANHNWLTYDSKVKLQGNGAAVISGHRLPMLYQNTRYEKFAKLILPVAQKSDGFDAVQGHRLEIVPMSNPLEARVGDELGFRIVLDGKPAAFDTIYATYSGFSDIPNAWAFSAAPVSHGQGRIKISASGLWVVRVAVVLDEKGKDYNAVDLKAVLTFPVK
jgi:ABC-type Co2+ transport system, periplasmic component